VIAALVSFGTMAARSGSSIEVELRAASINSPKVSAWRSTKSRLPRARARRTSALNHDRTPLSSSNPLQIVLFDIDGTLILTGGAGGRAMSRAFEDTFGIPGALHGIPMGGRTDAGILAQAAARAGLVLSADDRRRFRDRYVDCLREALPDAPHPKGVLPGVRPLLETLASRPDIFLALLTGNTEEGARLKLEHFDLWQFFQCGAFGDVEAERNDLFAVAMRRALACGAPDVAPANVIVIGDTELDVAVAVAAGARSVAVATGSSSLAALRQCGADVVWPDLSDVNAFLEWLR
jgi:phosphoglycolate phosphatase